MASIIAERDAAILVRELQHEAGREIALERPHREGDGQLVVPGHGLLHHAGHGLERQPRLHAGCEDLGIERHQRRRQQVVGRLHGVAVAEAAAVEEVRAHAVEHGTHARDGRLVAADHQRQRAGDRVLGRLADGAVDHAAAFRRERPADLARRLRRARAHVDHDRAGCSAGGDAVGPERDLLDIRRIGQHGDDDVAGAPRPPPATSRPCAPLATSRCTAAGSMSWTVSAWPFASDVGRHGPAHDAETDETDAASFPASLTSMRAARVNASAPSPCTSPQVSAPEATSSARSNRRAAAASRLSRPSKTGLASKSIWSGEPARRLGAAGDLDRRRQRAAVAVAGAGGEQHELRAGCDEPGDRFRREARPVHQEQPGDVGASAWASRPWIGRLPVLAMAPSDFSSIVVRPPRMFSAPGLLPVRSTPVAATARSRSEHGRSNGGCERLRYGAPRDDLLGAEPFDGLADDGAAAAIDEQVGEAAGDGIGDNTGRGIRVPALDAAKERRRRLRRPRQARRRMHKFAGRANAARAELERVFVRVVERNGAARACRSPQWRPRCRRP